MAHALVRAASRLFSTPALDHVFGIAIGIWNPALCDFRSSAPQGQLPRLGRYSRGFGRHSAALNSTRLASTASRCLLTTFCLIAAWQAISLSLATYFFRQGTVDSVSAALRLVPNDSTYLVDLAVRQPQNAVPLLKRAAVANPHDAAPWIQLGLIAEMRRRDPAKAEHDYLHAAKINRTSLTRWTLANFYFRQHRIAEAFHWSQATLQITASDATPIFLQLWSGADDPARIAAIIPDAPGFCIST